MEIGKLNRRVTIQRPATGEYPDGQPVIGWTDVATVWANVRYLNGIETVKADAVASVSKASIRIRRRTDVAASMRALDSLKVMVITGITKASPAVVTAAGHGLIDNQKVRVESVAGMTQVNSGVFSVAVLTADTFSLVGVDSTAYGTYASGGKALLVSVLDIKAVSQDQESRERVDLACEVIA